jgi:branched-chain amino acid transport system substrate-binding protein
VRPAGDGANGYKALTFNGLEKDYPIFDDLKKYVHDAGKGAGAGDQVGTVLYMRGLYSALMTAEAIKKAQEIHGTAEVTPAMVRDGYENLDITEATYEALGLPGFGPEIKGSCQNHGGQGLGAVSQWDAAADKFVLITDYIESNQDVIQPLIAEDSQAYADETGITPNCD